MADTADHKARRIVLDAIHDHLHGDASGADEVADAAIAGLRAAGLLPPELPAGLDGPRSAGVLIEVIPVGEPGMVGYRVLDAGPERLSTDEIDRILWDAAIRYRPRP